MVPKFSPLSRVEDGPVSNPPLMPPRVPAFTRPEITVHDGCSIGDPNQVTEAARFEDNALFKHPGGKGKLSSADVVD